MVSQHSLSQAFSSRRSILFPFLFPREWNSGRVPAGYWLWSSQIKVTLTIFSLSSHIFSFAAFLITSHLTKFLEQTYRNDVS